MCRCHQDVAARPLTKTTRANPGLPEPRRPTETSNPEWPKPTAVADQLTDTRRTAPDGAHLDTARALTQVMVYTSPRQCWAVCGRSALMSRSEIVVVLRTMRVSSSSSSIAGVVSETQTVTVWC